MNRSDPFPLARSTAARALAIGAACVAATAAPAAQAAVASDPTIVPAATVIAIVKVAKPWYAPRALVTSRMRDTIPQYAQLQGLAFKAFSFAREGNEFGGIYFWKDAASAQAWFDPAWFERVRRERGVEGSVRYFDALLSIDNTPGGTPLTTTSSSVATVVEIPIPAGISRERLYGEFRAAVPVYQKVPGLLRKHFTVSSNGTFGGVYLWKDEASANAWFNEAWHERVRKTCGTNVRIEWFDTPILLPTQRAENAVQAAAVVLPQQP